ncbi:rhodanese-like domain-containing protein [Planococcus sp. SSTMD024]|uniref:MBL fold metallo-hydrolase n=1 Tax=Planococcus sp. SSTMD024 TaxID=3242163 RepID=UPI00351E09FE
MTVKFTSAEEIAEKVMNNESVAILDVRSKEDVENWHVEGSHVELHNIPFNKIKESSGEISKLPKEKPLYTMCAKGNTSKKAAEYLQNQGFENVISIEGGMAAWSEQLEPVKIGDLKTGGAIYQFVRVGKGCLSYLVESDGEAAVIDAARMIEPYESFAKEHSAKITHVLDTHLHADHISGGRKLAEQFGAQYHLPPEDADEVVFGYEAVEDGTTVEVGKAKIKAFYSPGHTIGSTSFIVDDEYLLTGDILFIESIGRPDLAGKATDWAEDLHETLYERYDDLSKDLIVLPAHYADIKEMNEDGSVHKKLSELYKQNEGLNIDDEERFIKRVTENLKEQPNAYEDIRKTNMGKITPSEDEQKEMETGPNNCAV